MVSSGVVLWTDKHQRLTLAAGLLEYPIHKGNHTVMQTFQNFSAQTLLLKIRLAYLLSIPSLLLCQGAEAQMTIDIAKVTCRQYLFDRTISPEAPRVAAWLSGYFNGRRNNTTLDLGAFRSNKDKVEDYCRLNLDTTLIDAAKKSLGIDK
jgi:acid stress chaperone HdeB